MTIAGPSQKTNSGVSTTGNTYDTTYLSTPLPTMRTLTSGTTYTTPSGVQWIRVKMVGAGGGGAGSSTTAANNAGTGGAGSATTFGTSLLTANGGGGGGGAGTEAGGAGGTYTITLPAYGTGVVGGIGNSGPFNSTLTGVQIQGSGCAGAASPFGGQGSGGAVGGGNGVAAALNSGSGGGSGGNAGVSYSGGGGGAGGFIDAIIPTPAASYSYAIGTAGSVGAAGTGGFTGGLGGAGYIEVTEYYTGLVVGTSQAVTAANKVYAGPASGSAAVPSFRALVAADIPAVVASKATRITSSATITTSLAAITLNSVIFDTTSSMSGSGVYTAPNTGYYNVSYSLSAVFGVGSTIIQAAIWDGTIYHIITQYSPTASLTTNGEITLSASTVLSLTAGVTLTLYARSYTASSITDYNTEYVHFTVFQLK